VETVEHVADREFRAGTALFSRQERAQPPTEVALVAGDRGVLASRGEVELGVGALLQPLFE